MTHRHRYVAPLKNKEYHLLKVKVTHRNMRKLAALYKEFEGKQVYGGFKPCKMRFRYSTRYRKHPNGAGGGIKCNHMKDGKYIFIMTSTYSYTNQRSPRARMLLIKHINKENEQLIRYSVQRFFRGCCKDELPF